MIEQDTIRLLRECDAGIKMGITSINDVIDFVNNKSLKNNLEECRNEHKQLKDEIQDILYSCHDNGKDPNLLAKGMSWMKTSVKLVMNESDETIADLITDGCNMGVKSLNRYLNQYKAADEQAKNIARRLIDIEENLAIDLRKFL